MLLCMYLYNLHKFVEGHIEPSARQNGHCFSSVVLYAHARARLSSCKRQLSFYPTRVVPGDWPSEVTIVTAAEGQDQIGRE